jgi:hypothetical protein
MLTRILFTNYDIITDFLNLAFCSEHLISIKHRILATFNINKKFNSDSLCTFNVKWAVCQLMCVTIWLRRKIWAGFLNEQMTISILLTSCYNLLQLSTNYHSFVELFISYNQLMNPKWVAHRIVEVKLQCDFIALHGINERLQYQPMAISYRWIPGPMYKMQCNKMNTCKMRSGIYIISCIFRRTSTIRKYVYL